MSRIFICLFGLCILSIAIQFGDCENTQPDICADENIKPGSDKTRLALYEKALDVPKKIGDKIGNIWDKLRGKERNSQFVETQESIESQDQSTHQTVNKYINTIFPGKSINYSRKFYRENIINSKNKYLKKIFFFRKIVSLYINIYRKIYIEYFKF